MQQDATIQDIVITYPAYTLLLCCLLESVCNAEARSVMFIRNVGRLLVD
jgi:hypothetical protein